MSEPEQRYRDDAAYHQCVDFMEHMLREAQFTPSEMREMAVLAATHHERRIAYFEDVRRFHEEPQKVKIPVESQKTNVRPEDMADKIEEWHQAMSRKMEKWHRAAWK